MASPYGGGHVCGGSFNPRFVHAEYVGSEPEPLEISDHLTLLRAESSAVAPKIFTVEEANRLLPSLEPLLRRLQAKHQQLRDREQALEGFRARASRDGGGVPGADIASARAEIVRLLAEIQAKVKDIEDWGCVVKDLDRGLVDFPSRRGSDRVYLCWYLGETAINYWHGLQEGFAGRKPLRDAPSDRDD